MTYLLHVGPPYAASSPMVSMPVPAVFRVLLGSQNKAVWNNLESRDEVRGSVRPADQETVAIEMIVAYSQLPEEGAHHAMTRGGEHVDKPQGTMTTYYGSDQILWIRSDALIVPPQP
ncbi:hypothetical protein PRBEI_2001006800 [Prionailurus iriomotensis]